MTVVWTEESRRDLSEIREYISLDSPPSADRVLRQIIDSTQRLKQFPESGRRVPESPNTDLREVVVPPYRVIYAVQEGAVVILGVAHGRRDAQAFLARLRGEQ
ncbi:MAG: type II toxin-antitoxin system RelE/ParE family toxin [Acidobacteria bacterium]|nr:type II toxin-antitoxin system RelE/ParE family toxin [Acidobacteriota bacterium]